MRQVECIPVPSLVAILLGLFSPVFVDQSRSLKALPVCNSQYPSAHILLEIVKPTGLPSKAETPVEHPQ